MIGSSESREAAHRREVHPQVPLRLLLQRLRVGDRLILDCRHVRLPSLSFRPERRPDAPICTRGYRPRDRVPSGNRLASLSARAPQPSSRGRGCAARAGPRPRRGLAHVGAGARPPRRAARGDRDRPAGVRRLAAGPVGRADGAPRWPSSWRPRRRAGPRALPRRGQRAGRRDRARARPRRAGAQRVRAVAGRLRHAREQAVAGASLRATRALARLLAPVARTALGGPGRRTAVLGQLTGRPWRVPPAAGAARSAAWPRTRVRGRPAAPGRATAPPGRRPPARRRSRGASATASPRTAARARGPAGCSPGAPPHAAGLRPRADVGRPRADRRRAARGQRGLSARR